MKSQRKRAEKAIETVEIVSSKGSETIGEAVHELHERSIRIMRVLMEQLEETIKEKGKYDKALAGQHANLSRSIAALTAEARKREVHNRETVLRMTSEERDDLTLECVRDMSPSSRGLVRALLDEMDRYEHH